MDYRALSDLTIKDSYPPPRMEDTLNALVEAKWFSTLDMKSRYHQMNMEEEDKETTAFSHDQGLWLFQVTMLYGLCNVLVTSECLMERVFEVLHWKTA